MLVFCQKILELCSFFKIVLHWFEKSFVDREEKIPQYKIRHQVVFRKLNIEKNIFLFLFTPLQRRLFGFLKCVKYYTILPVYELVLLRMLCTCHEIFKTFIACCNATSHLQLLASCQLGHIPVASWTMTPSIENTISPAAEDSCTKKIYLTAEAQWGSGSLWSHHSLLFRFSAWTGYDLCQLTADRLGTFQSQLKFRDGICADSLKNLSFLKVFRSVKTPKTSNCMTRYR